MMPLYIASSAGQNAVVLELLDRNAQMEVREKGSYTLLYLTVNEGHLDTLKHLLEKGANG